MTFWAARCLRPEVEAVMALAGTAISFRSGAGSRGRKRICELLKLPRGYDAIVTCGAAAGCNPDWRES